MMKSKYLCKLNGLEEKHLRATYPNVPDHCLALTKWSDKTANGLEKCICRFLILSGHQAERIKNMGRMIDNTKNVTNVLGHTRVIGSKQYIKGSGTNGTADISATIKGRSVKIEVKIGKDRQSAAQKQYELDIKTAGGQYWIATDFDSFYFHYESFLDYLNC